ncbi:disease resistance protein [Salix suchowensis]|nr:disease resistance protein [Salix suchowensis]
MTWEFTQSVAERGSSSKRPVDRSVPSSSNNEATNAAPTPVRGLANELEEQPRLDDGLGGMDILIGGETELVEEPRAAVVLMTEQAHQSLVDDVLRIQFQVIVVEDCHNMGVIMGIDEEDKIRSLGLMVLVLKKLPSLNSIYSGRLECKYLKEITVNDCPQLTRIPLTIRHPLKKIQVYPESLRNSIVFF